MYRYQSIVFSCFFFLLLNLPLITYAASPITVADAGPDQQVFDEVILDGSNSYNAAEPISSHEWQLTHHSNSAYDRVVVGELVIVSDLFPGIYEVILTVRTDSGGYDEDKAIVSAIGPKGDLDGDFDVDGDDLKAFSDRYGYTISPEDVDNDLDHYTENQGDCDDDDPSINPAAVDICDSIDQDCDGSLDCPLDTDDDGDGYTELQSDCDDSDATVYPNAPELCDLIDHNCDGDPVCLEDIDNDNDGFTENEGDCNDSDPSVHPDAPELCDAIDQNCDGSLECPWQTDDDGDGYSEEQGDCNDDDDTIYPNAPEFCDAVDHNCDGNPLCPDDIDNDKDGYTENQGDCDDSDPFIQPGAAEICDGRDNDCNGLTDEVQNRPCGGSSGVCADAVDVCSNGSWQCNYPTTHEQYEEISCKDNLDNDCDGTTDLNDADCRSFNNTCAVPTYIGSLDADTGCKTGPSISRWGNTWIKVRAQEESNSSSTLYFKAKIENPPGVTYRMSLYDSCSGGVISMSTNEVITSWKDTYFSSDDREFYIRIERISGTSPDNWILTTFGGCP